LSLCLFRRDGLVPVIHVFDIPIKEDVDARDIQREDPLRASARA
jgi:hypothetical protein